MSEIITLEAAAKLLSDAQRVLLLCHTRPDGDTIGSAFALREALENSGKTVECACADPLPDKLGFITAGKRLLSLQEGSEFASGSALIAAIDVASPNMLGDASHELKHKINLRIDHHASADDFAEYNFADPSAAATAEIIFKLVTEHMKKELSAFSASALLAAVISDTGGFRYSNTTILTHKIAVELIKAGADNTFICHKLFEDRTPSEINALRAAYSNLELYMNGKVAVIMITNKIKKDLGLRDDELGEINSIPREIKGVMLGIVLKQSSDNPEKFKMSARSGEEVAADSFCKAFGGGGHLRAAGGSITAASPEEAMRAVLAKAEEMLAEIN